MNFIAETQKLQNYLRVQDYKAVVDGCEKLINKFPHNPFLFNLLGLALHGSGKYLVAIDRYKKALDIDKNFLPAMNNLANSYKSIGNFEEAELFYNKAIDGKPDYFQAYNNYANLRIEHDNLKDLNLKLTTQFYIKNSPASIEKFAKESLGMEKKRPRKISNDK